MAVISQPHDRIECRVGCGACCVFAAIADPFPGHPDGKAAGERCRNLSSANECLIYESRPEACRLLQARRNICGSSNAEAFSILGQMFEANEALHA